MNVTTSLIKIILKISESFPCEIGILEYDTRPLPVNKNYLMLIFFIHEGADCIS